VIDTGAMAGTFRVERLREVMTSSLFVVGGVYRRRPGGELQYDGARPNADLHAHGYFARRLWMLDAGPRRLVRGRIWKRRWLDPAVRTTCHSRPPDDAASVWSCTLIIALRLWSWLDSGRGLCNATEVVPELEQHPSERTVGRWLARAARRAPHLVQAIRQTVIERSEPRPVEHLFPAGLSPPEDLLHRPWQRDAQEIGHLWQALAWLYGGAISLRVPVALLLAEARGRGGAIETTFPI
jgi:hypothetical protein